MVFVKGHTQCKGEKHPMYGKHKSEETKLKISLSKKGKKLSEKTRKKMSESAKKKEFSENHRKNLSLSSMGKIISQNQREKIRNTLKQGYEDGRINSKNKGKIMSEEQKMKLSIAHKGKHLSEEHKKRVGLAGKGRIVSEQTRKKISLAQKGRILSEGHINKIKEKRKEQVIPFKDTKIEVSLQRELTNRGIKFEKHKPIIGQPDIFIEPNICIFADGDYWHANPKIYDENKLILIAKNKTAKEIWEKEQKINEELRKQGFLVMRYWETEINANCEGCIDEIEEVLLTTNNEKAYLEA